MSNRLQFVLHISVWTQHSEENLDGAYTLPGVKKDELTRRFFVRGRIIELDVEQVVPHRLDMGMVLNI